MHRLANVQLIDSIISLYDIFKRIITAEKTPSIHNHALFIVDYEMMMIDDDLIHIVIFLVRIFVSNCCLGWGIR